MKPRERFEWISDYMRTHPQQSSNGVNVLDSEFVDAYVDATDARAIPTPYGALICRQLGRDLSAMELGGTLDRSRAWLPYDLRGMGFPLWVWNYRLRE